MNTRQSLIGWFAEFSRQKSICGLWLCLSVLLLTLIVLPSITAQEDTPICDLSTAGDKDLNTGSLLGQMEIDGKNQIVRWDATTGQMHQLTHTDASNYNPALSPDGSQIVFTSELNGNIDLYLMDANGEHLQPLTQNDIKEYDPVWSPDGTMIAFSNTEKDHVYTIRADGSELRDVTEAAGIAGARPHWSPDSRQIVFTHKSHLEITWDLYVIHLETSEVRQLTFAPDSESGIDWSPDSTQIIYDAIDYGEDYALYIADVKTGQTTRLTTMGGSESSPQWSPDGTKILYQHGSLYESLQVYVVNKNGNRPRQVTNAQFGPRSAIWLDDTHILITYELQNNTINMQSLNIETGDIQQLICATFEEDFMIKSWQP